MKLRTITRIIVTSAMVSALIAAVPASAEGNFSISGTVTDALGGPLEKVRVEMGSQIAFTDGDGDYRFDVFLPGTYRMIFTRPDLLSTDRYSDPSVTEPHTDEDTFMQYRISASTTPNYVGATPHTMTLTADSWAPEGACLAAYELDEEVSLTFVEIRPEGTRRYTGQWTVLEGVEPGDHYIEVSAFDCDTFAVIGYGYAFYYVSDSIPPPPTPDTTPPTIDITAPREGHMMNRTTDLGASPDGSTRVIGTANFRATVQDLSFVSSVFFELFDSEGKIVWNCDAQPTWSSQYFCDEEITFFTSTRYTFRVTAKDSKGNVGVLNRKFDTYAGPVEQKRLLEL